LFRPDDLHAFLRACDFVVLAVPATESTRAMIGHAELHAMKRSAFIVNVARGSIIDQAALIDALKNGVIAGACLDVFEVEPLPADSPLWTLPNVIVTPHIAGMREDYEERFIDIFLDNLGRFARNAPLRNLVDVNRGY
jgi:phosphoglycerate dehydrogenase-like enzyme